MIVIIMSSFLFFACANASEFNKKKGRNQFLGLQVPPCKPNPKRERCDDE